ncbi:MAG: dehypoxanthine futalosine cyclase [Bacteroidales bacterium]|nr:dehypoxanthine futalosine cyclase [Bacteroidales bacterium]
MKELLEDLYKKALNKESLTIDEGLFLYEKAPLQELVFVGNELRKKYKPDNVVTWQIDRNVNITNSCVSQCRFCNFYKKPNDKDVYITTLEQYKEKIEELLSLGGNQLLLQGGLHPKLKLDFYTKLFRDLKKMYPNIKLHALGPPEIVHIARLDKISYKEVLTSLIEAGLDSLPGAGAEILCDRVRQSISPIKANTQQWLDVMHQAHNLGLVTSATMMFGHIETKRERIKHLAEIRKTQAQKPKSAPGFLAFIPWPFQDSNTVLQREFEIHNRVSAEEYIRTIAISRIMLNNIANIQASWLTVGKDTAQLCLHAGANDFGSIMIEENVVSAAGASYKFDAQGIQNAISEAGFKPQLRNQNYEYIDYKLS